MAFQPLYSTIATAHGGREGHVRSEDKVIDLNLVVPKGLGGPGGAGANPETLFSAGFAACFEGALRLVARTQKVPLKDVKISAKTTIGKTDDGGFGIAVELMGHFTDMPRPEAEQLMRDAHQVCPYSKATRGNIDVKLEVA